MKSTSKRKLREISSGIAKLCGELGNVRMMEERRRDSFPHSRRDSERFERLRYVCDVLEEAESNLEEAHDNVKSVFTRNGNKLEKYIKIR